MTAGKPLELEIPVRRMLELERAEKIVMAMASDELPGLTDDDLTEITDIAGEDAPLFDPDNLTLDGWRQDHNGRWVPPDIHAIDDNPVRGKDEHLRPAPGSASGTPSNSSTAAQKLAELTPTQFLAECEAIRNDELRERWKNDRENWIHRWDRRADVIHRWGGRQLP